MNHLAGRARLRLVSLAIALGPLACSSSSDTQSSTHPAAQSGGSNNGGGGSTQNGGSGGGSAGAGGSNVAGGGTGGAAGATAGGAGGANAAGNGGTAGAGAAGIGGSGGSIGDDDSGAPPAESCGLNTGYPGDDQCILPPPPDKGFQLHVGPADYANPDVNYILQPGEEKTTDFPDVSANDKDIYFFYRQYRLRPSAHHVIITTSNGGDVLGGRRIGTANRSEEYPTGGMIAPEDQGVGLPLAAHSQVSTSFHAINTTSAPVLREMWVNFWYRDASQVTQPATEWFNTGSTTFAIPPHTMTTLGPFTCSVQGDGRMLWLYGHRHANNTRFTVTRVRGAQRDVIYDANVWEEPLLLEYSSLVTNSKPDIAHDIEGGWNGILDLKAGDTIQWSCDVNNTQNSTLRFTNETFLGEMCIIDAEAVGSTCAGF